ncbi:MAG: SGNH/GDSL hydrolase family protein [Patiriisocius sp.]|uniref:SGNH/GDSL hydrolase family protein n=1 Tax=Patiriisocius sp. TaxID=2822396 RepID=UPI003EF17F0E
MNILKFLSVILLSFCLFGSCRSSKQITNNAPEKNSKNFSYLALGDSYTKGESVCKTCGFPSITAKAIESKSQQRVSLKQIAQTGWTTTQLLEAIANENLESEYDLVTLLIGVNNQFQGKPFSLYEVEFLALIDIAFTLAGGDTSKVIVLSIPDYGFTPYGINSGNMKKISEEIDYYNNYAKSIAASKNILFLNITDITRNGISNPDLVANDGLHPSKEAYQLVAERLLKQINF